MFYFVLVIRPNTDAVHRVKSFGNESDSDDEDYNVELDEAKMPPIEVPPGDHKLQSCYNLW